MVDLSIFTTPEAWISLLTLLFLEIILGVDNIVFISITSNRLAPEKQHIGRKLGLAGAMIMRILFLSAASYLVHMTETILPIDLGFWSHNFSIRDIVLLLGGLYLLYKGISELWSTVSLADLKHEAETGQVGGKRIGLLQAVLTIMVMDIVFSIDSVITAVGLAEHLIVMIMAVVLAIAIMMVFIDIIADFINRNVEMKILALTFIAIIGVLLVMESLGFGSEPSQGVFGIPLEKIIVYFSMLLATIMEFLQLAYKQRAAKWHELHDGDED